MSKSFSSRSLAWPSPPVSPTAAGTSNAMSEHCRGQNTTDSDVGIGKRSDLIAQFLEKYIRVADVAQCACQRFQVVVDHLGPPGFQNGPKRSQLRPQSPRCDSRLVHIIGIPIGSKTLLA